MFRTIMKVGSVSELSVRAFKVYTSSYRDLARTRTHVRVYGSGGERGRVSLIRVSAFNDKNWFVTLKNTIMVKYLQIALQIDDCSPDTAAACPNERSVGNPHLWSTQVLYRFCSHPSDISSDETLNVLKTCILLGVLLTIYHSR